MKPKCALKEKVAIFSDLATESIFILEKNKFFKGLPITRSLNQFFKPTQSSIFWLYPRRESKNISGV